jgi:uncharacterized protein (TIGR03032 family)
MSDSEINNFNPSSLHSDNLPALLQELNISLALTSFRSDRIMLVRSEVSAIDVLYQEIPRPMGLAVSHDRLVLGSWAQVLDYRRQDELGARIDPQGLVDACFVPRGSLVTGAINIHDIAWGDEGLWVVNSTFSCLATLSPDYNFVPRWKPHFIDKLTPDDSCHLNGMAMRDGRPAFITTFCRDDRPSAWRDFKASGTVMSVNENRVVVDQLLMPHSPRWIDGWLYFCESGHGRIWRCREDGSERTLVAELPGYTRGLDHIGSLLFVGLSRPRDSVGAPRLPLLDRIDVSTSGFWVIDLERLEEVAWLAFPEQVHQIYDVAILHGMKFPHLVEWSNEQLKDCYSYPPLV